VINNPVVKKLKTVTSKDDLPSFMQSQSKMSSIFRSKGASVKYPKAKSVVDSDEISSDKLTKTKNFIVSQRSFFNAASEGRNSILNSPPPEFSHQYPIPGYLYEKYKVFNTVIMSHMLDVSTFHSRCLTVQ
jgi:hypothetical protein